jgi:hypothetical protein
MAGDGKNNRVTQQGQRRQFGLFGCLASASLVSRMRSGWQRGGRRWADAVQQQGEVAWPVLRGLLCVP